MAILPHLLIQEEQLSSMMTECRLSTGKLPLPLGLACPGTVVVVLGFYVPPTAKVIRRRDLGLKSHPKDWRSPGSNSGPLVYKAGSLTARPRRLPPRNSVVRITDRRSPT